jgi:hypothetical protein
MAAGMEREMGKLAPIALACVWLSTVPTPSAAGCICKDTRGSRCAKNCYACFSDRAVPAGYCSYRLEKRKHPRAKDASR